jgi:hypothetical protein
LLRGRLRSGTPGLQTEGNPGIAEPQQPNDVLSGSDGVVGTANPVKVFPKSNGFDSRGNTIASGQRELNILNEAQRSAAQPEEQPPAK